MCRWNKIKPSQTLPCCSLRLLLPTWKQSWAKSVQRKNLNRKKKKTLNKKIPRMIIGEYWRTFLYTDQKPQSDNWGTILVVKTTPLLHQEENRNILCKQMGNREAEGSEDKSKGKIYRSSIWETKGLETAKRIRAIAAIFFFFKYRETSRFPCRRK